MRTNEDLLGTVIKGRYRLDRLIGSGGMGAVYVGTDLQLDRTVAVKILRSDLMTDHTMEARFEREARAAARIEHPNAVHVYDYGSIEDLGTYLVMEFAEGVSLRQYLTSHGRLSLETVLDLVQQTAAALDAAHVNGVIHRDVKPENLMVCFSIDGRPVVKVVDFGIAKLLTSDGTTQLTRPTDIIGTPRYMAPEQFTEAEIDARVDVYALGVVLFELLTGQAPFEGTFSEIIGKHIYAEPPTFEALGVAVPPEVERVVRRTLAKDPAARPQTTAQLASELAEACGPEVPAAVTTPFAFILRPSGELPPAGDAPSAPPARATTVVAGSPVRRALATVAGALRELPTVVRREPSHSVARLIVPFLSWGSPGAAPPTGASALRWAVPAGLALAGCLTFGTVALRGSGEAAAVPEFATPAAVARPAPKPAPMPAPPAAEPAKADRAPEPAAPSDPEDRSVRRRAAPPRGKQNDTALKKVGRALRIDQHLRKLF